MPLLDETGRNKVAGFFYKSRQRTRRSRKNEFFAPVAIFCKNIPIMIGKTLSHFKVLDRLGKGGMGEVYIAEDTKLKRKVALKVLPQEVAQDPARLDRFQREAESIAALNHPNIVTIYSIEEADGIRFLTMELVEGETLIQLIPSNGLDVESFVRYSAPVAEALSAAHEKGIVHRDLKPANIMVSREGRVKVLDFGLAKLIREDPDPNSSRMETHAQTEAGMVLGTMPYMSPEQIQGKRLDHRSDIFSLGIIFYEMMTGRRPFGGDTSADLISAIMRDTPGPVSDWKAIPEHLERIIRRCLLKDPRDRYQTARDVFNELRDLSANSGPSTRPATGIASGEMWIAVLPFQHPATDSEIETFADGLVQDITAALSQFSYLSVIAQESTERMKARYVIQGGIRKSGSLMRVNVQLIDTRTGANLWAETYNRDLKSSDIFTIQDEITDRVAATLADQFGVLVRSIVASLEDKPEETLSGNDFVFRFFRYWAQLTPEEHAKIRTTLERAVERIPRNADIWACLSLVYYHEFAFGFNELPNSLDRCLAAAQRAVELNRTSQLAYEALTWAQFFRRDVGALPATVERAISLNPRNSHMLAVAGLVLVHTRNFDRGATVARRAMELNPHHAGWYHFSLIWDYYSRREFEQTLEQAKRVNMPGFFWPPLVIASVCGELGRKAEATAAVNELLAIDPEFAAHARRYIEPWHYGSGLMDSLMEGLRKAGLEVSKTESRNSIAVLPFTNLSADPENEYFCDGLAEELLNALAKIEDLKVAARTSSFSFRNKSADAGQIAQALNVKTILEGSVRRSGKKLRITVQLINATDGYHLWSERYDRELQDIFDVQEEIALAVVDALKLKLLGNEKAAMLKRYTNDAEVHELFLKGRYYSHKYTAEGWKRAIEFFERAIEKQPDYAPAQAGLASSYGCLWFFGFLPAEKTMPQCRAATIKALKLDENLTDAYLSQAIITFFYDWEWAKAEQAFQRSILLNANNAEALSYYALFLSFEERFEEAIRQGKRSLEMDPLSPLINMNVGWTYFSAGLLDEALEQTGKMIEMEPDFYGAYWLKGAIHLSNGEYMEAIDEFQRAVSRGGHQIVLADLASAYALAGKKEKAGEILERLLEMRQQDYVPAICMARVYSRIGENEKAMDWFEKAFDERNGELVFLKSEIAGAAENDPLKNLGNDARLIELLQKMK